MAYLKEIRFNWSEINKAMYPFCSDAIKNTELINMDYNVIFFVGERI